MTTLPIQPDATTTAARKLRWSNILMCGAFHLGCVAAPFYFSWSAVAVCFFLGWVSCCLGITLGWHRLLTHRGFETFKPIEYFLTICGCIAAQNSPVEWVGTHRLHHAHTDEPADPHSPRDHARAGALQRVKGFLWSHMGWIAYQPDFDPASAARDLQRDPVMRVIDRFYFVPILALAAGLYFLGRWVEGNGMAWLVWGVFVRTSMMYHATWFVNSATHVWGYRNFDTRDDSTNLWWVALITFGEGWHNNHHAQQKSARHGIRWWEFDLTWQIIRAMRATGLLWGVVEPDVSKMR